MFSNMLSSIKTAMTGCIDNGNRISSIEDTVMVDARDVIVIDNMPSITNSKDAVIYCRVSTPQQSLEAQEYACKIYCERKGYNVINVIKEYGSAFKARQPKLKDFISSNKDMNLIIYKADRFSRNTAQCDLMIQTMATNKINLECITDPVNLTSSLGRHSFREAILKAQFESEQIGERIKASHRYRVANGIQTQRPTYGYTLNTDRRTVMRVANEQHVIKFIIGTYRTRKTAQDITEMLFKLMGDIGGFPEDHFVPVEIESCSGHVYMSARIIAELLNDYNINNRGRNWSSVKILKIYNNAMDMSNLTI